LPGGGRATCCGLLLLAPAPPSEPGWGLVASTGEAETRPEEDESRREPEEAATAAAAAATAAAASGRSMLGWSTASSTGAAAAAGSSAGPGPGPGPSFIIMVDRWRTADADGWVFVEGQAQVQGTKGHAAHTSSQKKGHPQINRSPLASFPLFLCFHRHSPGSFSQFSQFIFIFANSPSRWKRSKLTKAPLSPL
jgi:hypothetical protein